jgi:transposase
MATKRNSRKTRRNGPSRLGKPNGIIQPRVQAVGPERFAVAAVDCAKARSMWMLFDFYGKILLPEAVVEHGQMQMQLATMQFHEACQQHGIRDAIVAIEMTGTYHRPIQRAFRKSGAETRLVHPFASSHYRRPENPDDKTDEHDLAAIFRAAVNGFGLLEPAWDETYLLLQLYSRHRRDLVEKRAKLQCQIRHHLDGCMPGYTDLFPGERLWKHPTPLAVAREAITAEAIRKAGIPGVTGWLRAADIRFRAQTVEKIVAWAGNASDADPLAAHIAGIWQTLYDDWQAKTRQITALERKQAEFLVKTPYSLVLSTPGINVVSAAELAGEMGPIEYYASAKAVTGRAGLFPSRYQSDQVDRADGPLVRHRNARLRAAWMRVADNLLKCNAHYRAKFQLWKQQRVNARDIRCRIANRAVRPIFRMVSGGELYHHPSRLDRSYVMEKLLTFHRDHNTPPHEIVRDLQQAAKQIPKHAYAEEAGPLQAVYERSRRSRRKEPQPIGTLLVAVLARLGVTGLESNSEAQGLVATVSERSTR